MDLQNFLSQMSMSNNPITMALGMLPNNGLKQSFNSIANSKNDEERAQRIADWCNARGISKAQLQQMLQRRF